MPPDDIKSKMLEKLKELGYSEYNATQAVYGSIVLNSPLGIADVQRTNKLEFFNARQEALEALTIENLSLTSDKLVELRKSSERQNLIIAVLTAVLVFLTAVLVTKALPF
jgi:hypothetical protein